MRIRADCRGALLRCSRRIPFHRFSASVLTRIVLISAAFLHFNGLRGGNNLDSMHERTEYDPSCLRTWTPWLDVLIPPGTAPMLLAGGPRAL